MGQGALVAYLHVPGTGCTRCVPPPITWDRVHSLRSSTKYLGWGVLVAYLQQVPGTECTRCVPPTCTWDRLYSLRTSNKYLGQGVLLVFLHQVPGTGCTRFVCPPSTWNRLYSLRTSNMYLGQGVLVAYIQQVPGTGCTRCVCRGLHCHRLCGHCSEEVSRIFRPTPPPLRLAGGVVPKNVGLLGTRVTLGLEEQLSFCGKGLRSDSKRIGQVICPLCTGYSTYE